MGKLLLLGAILLGLAAPAYATTGSGDRTRPISATTSVPTARSFSLPAAHHAAVRLERLDRLARWAHIGRCRWLTPRKAACPVTFGPVAIVDGSAPVSFAWADYVIRPAWSPQTLFEWSAGLRQIN